MVWRTDTDTKEAILFDRKKPHPQMNLCKVAIGTDVHVCANCGCPLSFINDIPWCRNCDSTFNELNQKEGYKK